MPASFNSLKRKQRYTFVFGSVPAITGVFHELLPDGSLLVAGSAVTEREVTHQYHINHAAVLYAREES